MAWTSLPRRATALLTGSLLVGACAPRTAIPPPPLAPTELVPGESGTRTIRGDGEQVFAFDAREGDFIQVLVEQQGLDVVVSIYDAEGARIRAVSSRERRFGPELAWGITATSGLHEIRVRPASAEAPEGVYRVALETVRPSTDADRSLLELEGHWYAWANEMFEVAGRGEWDRAMEIYWQWLETAEEFDLRDGKQRDVAVGAVSLSRALWNNNVDREMAETMLSAAVDYLRRTQGESSYLAASTERMLADLYLGGNRREEAWALLANVVERLEAAPDSEPAELALALISIGRYHRQRNELPSAIDFLARGLARLEEELNGSLNTLLTIEDVILQTEFELANAYRLAGDLEGAKPMFDRATREDAFSRFSPPNAFDRLSIAASLWLDTGEYERLQDAVSRALRIGARFPLDVVRTRNMRRQSAEGYLLAGNHAVAETAYYEALAFEGGLPEAVARPAALVELRLGLAGLYVDQGHYRDANAVYREALSGELAIPSPDRGRIFRISADWSAMLRDLGLEVVTELEQWASGDRTSPPPTPPEDAIPALLEPGGLTRDQILRRLRPPYTRDLRTLWADLGAGDWSASSRCERCAIGFVWTRPDRLVLRVSATGAADAPVRYLLLGALDPNDEPAVYRLLGTLDLPSGDRPDATRLREAGDRLFMVTLVRTGEAWPRDHAERWYEAEDDGIVPASPYPDVFPDRENERAALLGEFASQAWRARRDALWRLAAMPGALGTDALVDRLVELLESENAQVAEAAIEGRGPALAFGREYPDYVQSLVELLISEGRINEPRALGAMVGSAYDAETAFSRSLADRAGPRLVPAATDLISGEIPHRRWNGLSLLGRVYERREMHGLAEAAAGEIRTAILASCTHAEISTARLAVQILGRIGSPADAGFLRELADSPRPAGFSIRSTALEAIEAIEAR